MQFRWIGVVVALIPIISAHAHPEAPPKVAADLVLVNAKIWTVDPTRPEAEALAVWKGRILAMATMAETTSSRTTRS